MIDSPGSDAGRNTGRNGDRNVGRNGDREVCWELPADPEFVGKVRRMVGEVLVAWGMGELIEDVTLTVSELYTNALLYAEPPITLALAADGGVLRGRVGDHGAAGAPKRRRPDEDGHGRGLMIVSVLAERWGVIPNPGGRGKTIWFRFRAGAW